jgi:hypothetical protein
MINIEFQAGMVTALSAIKQTLDKYPNGLSKEEVEDMKEEIEQQIAVKNTEIQISEP